MLDLDDEAGARAELQRIVGLGDAVLGNLLITQRYHDLSQGLASVLGRKNVNWSTFATWASKTAGESIRDEELPKPLLDLLEGAGRFDNALEWLNRSIFGGQTAAALQRADVIERVERTLGDVSHTIAEGNLKVFAELAPEFLRAIVAFGRDTEFNQTTIEDLLTEHVAARVGEKSGDPALAREVHDNRDQHLGPLLHLVTGAWRPFATHYLMRLALPGHASLSLGADVPPLSRGQEFPAPLLDLTCPGWSPSPSTTSLRSSRRPARARTTGPTSTNAWTSSWICSARNSRPSRCSVNRSTSGCAPESRRAGCPGALSTDGPGRLTSRRRPRMFPQAMKPGDHPDFFRFPPPPGRSRESTIRLDAEGRFWHDGEPITHAGMARAFASWIDRHPDDGRYILTNGFDWTYFTVDDVPYFVRSLRIQGDRAILQLSDGSEEPLDPSTLEVGPRDALYLKVKEGSFDARFTQSAQTALGPLLVEDEDGEPALRLGGRDYRIGHRSHPTA